MVKVDTGKLYELEEVKDLLQGKLSVHALRKMIHRGDLAASRLGKRKIVILGEDIEKIFNPIHGGDNA